MGSIKQIHEAHVPNGKGGLEIVHSGDTVELLRASLMKKDGSDEEYFAQMHHDFLKSYLGNGPYEISWIGKWPCGHISLYLKTKDRDSCARASYFYKP